MSSGISSWIGSLDIPTYISTLVTQDTAIINANASGKITALTNEQTDAQAQVNVFSQVQTMLSTFTNDVNSLNTSFTPTYQLSYSASGIASGNITGTATAGTHTLTVTSLAQADSVASTNTYTSETAALGMTNTLSFAIGNGTPTNTFNVNIQSGDNLQSIAANINATAKLNGANVVASVILTGNGQYQLMVASGNTGLANKVNISESGTGANALNISTGTSGTATVLTSAADASFTFDNLNYTGQSTNSFTIGGVTYSLTGQGTTKINLTAQDTTSQVSTALQTLVTDYNSMMKFIEQSQAQLTSPNANLQLLQTSLQSAMSNMVVGSGSGGLSSLGVQADTSNQSVSVNLANGSGSSVVYYSGLLTVDSTQLTTALGSNSLSTYTLLFGNNGLMTNLQNNVLEQGLGSAWLAVNDVTSGGVVTSNKLYLQATQALNDENSSVSAAITALKDKYATLQATLQTLQNTSAYLTAQSAIASGG